MNTALIIEPRKHKAIRFVLANVMECLPAHKWKILFFHGETNGDYVEQQLAALPDAKERVKCILLPGVVNLDQHSYSCLLATKDSVIYSHVDTPYFLIFQTDSIMFPQHAHYMDEYIEEEITYVGAPWMICNYPPTKERAFIGNGGFSLRKTATMMDILEKHTWNPHSEWHEDLFFSKHYPDVETKKPTYENAMRFCVDEVFCADTMASHRSWCHQHYHVLKTLYPELETLQSLQSVETEEAQQEEVEATNT